MVLTLLLSAYKLCRVFTMSGPRPGAERLAVPGPEGGGGAGPWWAAGCRGPREVSPGVGAEVQGALERALPELAEVFQLVEEAWLLPAVGREVAQGLCEAIRLDGGLDLLPRLLQASELETRVQAARLLEQILVAENRNNVQVPASLQDQGQSTTRPAVIKILSKRGGVSAPEKAGEPEGRKGATR
ncbi:NAD(+) hydrolase SARM1-like isoform X6 [Choloepus didactylus]|uniref:NAD(+) hydrolase SARM1-like isoform X6 n=1 Tax=Choloepus didactylus TaxID=27675 RepID=UPI00189CDC0C|nr:NAD(+) hydrolase SARM1-like isoform X6 [Choloepus didactylus]